MFTGIIESVAAVESIRRSSDGMDLLIRSPDSSFDDVALGDSICVSGICLTVNKCDEPDRVGVFVSNETIARSKFGDLGNGELVNIEHPLTINKGLSGHVVTGHVDGLAQCVDSQADGASTCLAFFVDQKDNLGQYIAQKGSIAIEGVSMTVNAVNDTAKGTDFSVNLIPFTQKATTLGQIVAGDYVHIEVDILARYAKRVLEATDAK